MNRTSEPVLAWFPLIPRPRPLCHPLDTRIRQLTELATTTGGNDPLTRAAEVCNKAALIASDCGLSDLARALCWRQFDVFSRTRPLPARAARLALQPLLNLARQLTREGHGDAAYTMLDALHRAARDQADLTIDGSQISLRDLARTPEGHTAMRTLAWSALLADGTRALVQAGRWQQAAESAAAHHGTGQRLLDGRQITILALAHSGHAGQARQMLEQTTIAEPWEQAIQNLLRVLCQPATPASSGQHIRDMLATTLEVVQHRDPATTVFRTRTGLTALSLADTCDDKRQLSELHAELVTVASGDAYAARDALTVPALQQMLTGKQHQHLASLVRASGLSTGAILPHHYQKMFTAVAIAEDQLRALVGCKYSDRPFGVC